MSNYMCKLCNGVNEHSVVCENKELSVEQMMVKEIEFLESRLNASRARELDNLKVLNRLVNDSVKEILGCNTCIHGDGFLILNSAFWDYNFEKNKDYKTIKRKE